MGEKKMADTTGQIMTALETWRTEDEKFMKGNNAAGTRARKALAELSKLIKARRNEITEIKNTRKEEKTAK